MKQGQKLTHLRNGDTYTVMNILRHDRYLIESHRDCIVLHKCDISLNFKTV